jgi:vacuolar protein-sorting-associated protein 4
MAAVLAFAESDKSSMDDLLDKAIDLAVQAKAKDDDGDYRIAFKLYLSALNHFSVCATRAGDSTTREFVRNKFSEYLDRAEKLKELIDSEKISMIGGTVSSGNSTRRRR